MADEIDRLEITVETEANRANRSLSGMEKRLDRIADKLEKVVTLTAGLKGLDNFDMSGLADFQKGLDDILDSERKVGREKISPRVDRSDLKYAKKSMQELQKQYKDSKLEVDVSVMGENELKKFIAQTERGYNRLKQTLADTIKLNGSDVVGGKAWYRANMQIMQYENALDDAREALERLKAARKDIPGFTIDRGYSGAQESNIEGTSSVASGNYEHYDSSEIEKCINDFAGATAEANTFEAQIKRLKAELSDLASQGYSQYDPEYDKVAQELAEVTEAQRQYNRAMKENAKASLGNSDEIIKKTGYELADATRQAGLFKRALNGIKGSSKKINSVKKDFDNVGKSIKNTVKIAKSALHPLRSLRGVLSGESGTRRMSMGRMLGSSLLFNSVFKTISTIQNAIKEGSDNLVQYSSEYNYSISSMVSSLLYLKNAWAAAFSPIVNVVAPYISQFVDMMASALNSVGQFMAALTGKGFAVQAKKVWKDYAAGLDTAKDSASGAKKELEDLKNYTLGIDELNVIQPKDDSDSGSGSGSSGSGGAEISPSDMFETIEVSDSMSTLVEKFKEAIAKSDFTEIGQMIGDKLAGAMEGINWDSVYQKASNFGKDLATFLNGLISPRLFYDVGETVANSINTAFHAVDAFAINFDWSNLGESLAKSLKGFFKNWDARLTADTFSNLVKGILNAIKSSVDAIGNDDVFKDIGQKIVDFIVGIDWKGLTYDLVGFFDSLFDALIDFPQDFARGFMEELIKELFGVEVEIPSVPKAFKDIVKSFSLSNVPGFRQIKFIGDIFSIPNDAKEVINAIKPLFDKDKWEESAKGAKEGIEKVFSDAYKSIKTTFSQAPDFFGGITDEIEKIFSPIGDFIGSRFKKGYDATTNTWQNGGSFFGGVWSGIKAVFSPSPGWFKNTFQSAYNFMSSIWDKNKTGGFFSGVLDEIQKVLDKVSPRFGDAFRKARKAVEEAFSGIERTFKDIANNIISPVGSAVNGIIGGVNWVLDKVGSSKRISEWSVPRFAKGTGGLQKDTFGMVNDQKGSTYRELIVPPSGKPFIPEGRDVLLPLQRGTKIMPADQTKELMSLMPHFAGGIGDFFGDAWAKVKDFTGNVFDYITHPDKIVQIAIDKFVDISNMVEPISSIAKGAVSTVFDGVVDFIKGIFDEEGAVNYNPSAGVEQWRNLAKKALQMTGQYTEANLNRLLFQMQTESGGNPNAINNWDINAINGVPSKGLMQVIDPTFRAYAYPGYDKNIYDPLSNMLAAIRYTVSRYGSLAKGWQGHGYASGIGKIKLSDFIPMMADGGLLRAGQMFIARERGPELVGNYGNKTTVMPNNQIVQSVSNGVEAAFERQNARTNALLEEIAEHQKMLLDKETTVNIDGKKADKQLTKARRNSGYSFSPA